MIKLTKGDESSRGNQDNTARIINKSCKMLREREISETINVMRVSKIDYSFVKAVSWLVFNLSPESSTLLGVIT